MIKFELIQIKNTNYLLITRQRYDIEIKQQIFLLN